MKIKDLLPSEQPREKALRYGIDTLSDAEVLAILIGSGTRKSSAIVLGEKLIARYQGLVNLVKVSSVDELKISGISNVRALKILAAINLSKRLAKNAKQIDYLINSIDIVSKYLFDFSSAKKEMLLLVCLDKKRRIINETILYVGTKKGFDIDIEEIFDKLKQNKAVFYVLIHNHPSGNIYPSVEDIEATDNIKNYTKSQGIILDDHIIIAKYNYLSFKERGLL